MIQVLPKLSEASTFIRPARACQGLRVRQINLTTRKSKSHFPLVFLWMALMIHTGQVYKEKFLSLPPLTRDAHMCFHS